MYPSNSVCQIPMPSIPTTELRKYLKRQRARLPRQQQQQLAQQMAKQARQQGLIRNARHIALYLPVRGEADPRPLFRKLPQHLRFYLPVLDPCGRGLWFMRWDKHTRLHRNRFNILEPKPSAKYRHNPRFLDAVITPLVAFADNGVRMGMGGGFYDRTFAFKQHQSSQQRPLLLGYAYDFQQQNQLTAQPWDIPLDAVVTESKFLKFRTGIY